MMRKYEMGSFKSQRLSGIRISANGVLILMGFLLLPFSLSGMAENQSTGIALKDISSPSLAISLPQHVEIPLVSEEIQIDGKLDEPLWKKAILLTPFYLNNGSGTERESTQLRLAYDDQALYIGWTCRDEDIQATFTERDSTLWDEEVVEMFLTSDKLTLYYELQWNPLGTIFDARIQNRLNSEGLSKGIDGDWDWTAEGMQSAVWVDGTVQKSDDTDTMWQVEVRLPFSALGDTIPKSGEVWRGNFYRYSRTQGRDIELCSWSPTLLPSFHEPSRFGYFEFKPQWSEVR
mgnify:CR=1 FL=1